MTFLGPERTGRGRPFLFRSSKIRFAACSSYRSQSRLVRRSLRSTRKLLRDTKGTLRGIEVVNEEELFRDGGMDVLQRQGEDKARQGKVPR